jgi:phosphohistidine phosphatase
MKSILFVRHSKSSWDDLMIEDHDRPLNTRGKKDSKSMGEYLLQNGNKIDIIISSSAKRAKSTAKNLNEVVKAENFIIEPRLYLASAMEILKIVQNIHNEVDTAIIVAHNPGMTDVANIFSTDKIINVPTSGVFKIDFVVDDWSLADSHNGTMKFFIYPKMIYND